MSAMPSNYVPFHSPNEPSFHTYEYDESSTNDEGAYDTDQTFPMKYDNEGPCTRNRKPVTPDVAGDIHLNSADGFSPPAHSQHIPREEAHFRQFSNSHKVTRAPRQQYEMREMGSLPVPKHNSTIQPLDTQPLLCRQPEVAQPEYHSLDRKSSPKHPTHDVASISAPSTPQTTSGRRCRTSDGWPVQKHHSEIIYCREEGALHDLVLRSNSVQDGGTARKPRVFITYANDGKKHVNRILKMAYYLMQHNIDVAIDVAEQKLFSQDKMGWIERRFRGADKVTVVISPEYFRVIGGNEVSWNNVSQDDFSPHGLNTRYIHKLMQTEYLENRCRNNRFMPVVFTESGANRQHVPQWLDNTLIYNWPRHDKSLIMHVKDCYWYYDILDFGT